MLTANKLISQGKGLAPALLKRASTVDLDWSLRQKSCFGATDAHGRQIGVDLPHGTNVRGGDVLVAEDGSLIRVLAAQQAVLVITPCASHGSTFDLTRAAYQRGTLQVAVELHPDHLKIAPDHALAEKLRAMHLDVVEATAAFEPKGGADAYNGGEHRHSPALATKTTVPIAIAGPAAAPHVHGPHCNHGHNHAP